MPGVTMTLFDFLERNDLQTLHDRFVEEDVDMTVLPLMDKDDLKELGLTLGQRKKLLTGLEALNSSKDVAVATDTPSGNPIQLRRLSVLFCDMIGSTELGEQLDIDEMHVVLQHYYDTANIIAQKHGGHVAATQGDGLVLLFGYPRVLDGFAEQCVMAAQDLQTALAEKPVILEGHGPIFIETRVGIASGQAAVGLTADDLRGDHMQLVGPVVNRAARLQTVANPQSIAVDINTRDLTRSSVLYSEVELHALKGLPGRVEVFHVLELRETAQGTAAPITLIGRKTETSILSNLWSQAKTGTAVTATISGDAGIGKSTMIQNFIATQIDPQVRILHLRCTAITARSPLRPVTNALQALINDDSKDQSLSNLLNHPTPEMLERAAQFLEIADPSSQGAPISLQDRDNILDLLADWIVNDLNPTLLLLENAQWADETTLELMARAGKRADGAALLMIAASRDDDTGIWSGPCEHTTLALAPLDAPHSDALLRSIVADKPMPQSIRENILYHAGGNPLMLETLGHAQSQHKLPEVNDAVTVPHTIYESVSKRLDNIRSGRRVIEALAVIGTAASRQLVADVLELEDQDMHLAIEALHDAELVTWDVQDQKITIRHKVYRDVIYEQIAGPARRQLHNATYRALTSREEIRPEVLATHAQAARNWEGTARHALNAGEALIKRSALIETGHFLEMADAALERLPNNDANAKARLRTVTGLASVQRSRFGIATDRSADLGQKAVQLARDLGDSKAELLALNGLYSYALVRSDYPQAEAYAQALLETAELSQDKTFVMIGTRATGAVAFHRGDQNTAVRNLSYALEQYDKDAHLHLAHAHGYDHAEICAAFLSMSHWLCGDLTTSRHFGAFSIDHSREIDHAHSLAQAIAFRVMLGALARHGDELDDIGAEGIHLGEKYDIRVMHAAALFFPFATRLCLQPDPPSAYEIVQLTQRVDDLRKVNPFNYGPLVATLLAEIYLKAGDLDAAEAALREGVKTESITGETWTAPELLRLRARVASDRGDVITAARLRADALETAKSAGALTLELRITCDIAESDPEAIHAVRDVFSRMASNDQGWDMTRAQTLFQTGCDA